jgi:hemerythrin-like domain-containing protein
MDQEMAEVRHPITPLVSRIVETHRRIRSDLAVLEKSDKASEIRSVVEDLPGLLKEHFEDEEKPGGLFDELATLHPVCDSQLESLRREHREILEALEGLQRQFQEADRVSQVGELEQRYDHIFGSASAFIELIRHHERIESLLVANTYYTEDGGSG